MTKEIQNKIEDYLKQNGILVCMENNERRKCYLTVEKDGYIYVETGGDIYEDGVYVADQKVDADSYCALFRQDGEILYSLTAAFPYYHYNGQEKLLFLDEKNLLLPIKRNNKEHYLDHFKIAQNGIFYVSSLNLDKYGKPKEFLQDKQLLIMNGNLYHCGQGKFVPTIEGYPYTKVIDPKNIRDLSEIAVSWKISEDVLPDFVASLSTRMQEDQLLGGYIKVGYEKDNVHFFYDVLVLLDKNGEVAHLWDIPNVYYSQLLKNPIGLEENRVMESIDVNTNEEMIKHLCALKYQASCLVKDTIMMRSEQKHEQHQFHKRWGN